MSIHKTMVDVAKSTDELFRKPDPARKGRRGVVATKLGRELEFCLGLDVWQICKSFRQHRLDPYFNLFVEVYRASRLWRGDFIRHNIDDLNEFVQQLRSGAKRVGFMVDVNNHERTALKNAKTVEQYFSTMYGDYAKILHVRLNFYYESTWPRSDASPVSAKQMKAHRARIMRYVRRTFPAVIGHMWTIEYGEMKGPNFHVIIHLNGHKARQGIDVARQIGEHWRDVVTDGHGCYLNVNKFEDQFEAQGRRSIGLISHADGKRRSNLLQAALCLVKTDIFARVAMPGFGKTFGRGRIRPRKKSNAGRKRKGYRLQAAIKAIAERRGIRRP
jgi:hypothetical protein